MARPLKEELTGVTGPKEMRPWVLGVVGKESNRHDKSEH
jgi:hypothetical protein